MRNPKARIIPICAKTGEGVDLLMAEAEKSNKAVIVIGRTAGEDKDNSATPGSYYLTELEEELLRKVTRHFAHVCVVLNVGNIMDMSWCETYGVDSVLYVWHIY